MGLRQPAHDRELLDWADRAVVVRRGVRAFSPKHSAAAVVRVAVAEGVVAIRLPDAVHPWQLLNLAYWMLDGLTAG